jgi:hypothetical protein
MRKFIAPVLLALLPSTLSAQPVADEAPPSDLAAKVAEATAVADAGGEGRFKAEMVSDPGLPTHTIYRPPNSYAAQLGDAIDWAVAENARKGSPYFGKLDTAAIAVMGQSCGGLQAISAAADKRVKTLVVLNSGTFSEGTKPLAGTGDAIKASLKRIHMPVAWISGDASDVAHANADADFAAFTTGPALRAWHKGTGHSAHWRDVHGGLFTPLVIDWLDYRLKQRSAASASFAAPNCTLCKAEGWFVARKGF